jgi:hypothetical protein
MTMAFYRARGKSRACDQFFPARGKILHILGEGDSTGRKRSFSPGSQRALIPVAQPGLAAPEEVPSLNVQ